MSEDAPFGYLPMSRKESNRWLQAIVALNASARG